MSDLRDQIARWRRTADLDSRAGAPVGKALREAIAVIERLTQRAEQAEARVTELENALNWETSCLACSRLLTASLNDTARAEEAEAAVERARDVCARIRSHPAARPWADAIDRALDQPEEGQ